MHRTKHSNRPEKVTVAYDPNVADEVYLLFKPNSREYWTCRLSNISREYRGRSFWEIWRMQDAKKKLLQKHKLEADIIRAQHEDRVLNIIKSAEKEAPVATSSKSERLANIGKARASELELEREGNRRTRPEYSKSADVISLPNTTEDHADYPLYLDELFDDDGDK